jgi:phenylacetate-CoA ligase
MKARLLEAKAGCVLYQKRSLPDPDEIKTLQDWAKVPLLTKQDLLSVPVKDRLHSSFSIDDLIVSKSSGSTGQALDVYYDRESFYTFILAGLRLYGMVFRYWPWRRQTYIYTSPYPASSLFGLYPLRFISTLTPIPETLKILRQSPPDLLVCYPSHLRALVDQMTEEDFQLIRPRAINVNSEMSSAAERKFLGEKLGAFVFDDYSSEELTRIASQCRNLKYHVFDDINYLEVVDDDGQPVPEGVIGNLVGTNLHNRAMPLLRYMQGDRGAISTESCTCGYQFRVLTQLDGRKNDSFLLPNGQTLSSGFLLDLTYGVFLNYAQALQAFCLIQERPDVWILEVVPGIGWKEELAEILVADLGRDLRQPDVQLVLRVVTQVSRTASGKANPIISRVKKT